MTKTRNFLKALQVSTLIALFTLTFGAAAKADGIFQDAQFFSPKAAEAEVVLDNWHALQTRYVELDAEKLIDAVARKNIGGKQYVDLNLFPDADLRGVVENIEQRGDIYTLHLDIESAEHFGRALLTFSDAGFVGHVQVDDRIFEIMLLDENTSAVMEIQQLGEHEDEHDYVEIPAALDEVVQKFSFPTTTTVAKIKVLLLLPQNYFSPFCSNSQFLNTLASNYESSLDQYMNTSSMPFKRVNFVVKVACQNAVMPTGDWSADLSAFKNNSTVQALRDQHNADMVSGIVPNLGGNTYGIGYVAKGGVSSDSAYSLARIDKATSHFTLHHELGHNFGMYHNREKYDGNGDPNYCHYGKLLYKNNGNLFGRTIMGSGSDSLTRYGVFSNPNITGVNGTSTVGGVACSQSNSADNEKLFISRAPTIANFR